MIQKIVKIDAKYQVEIQIWGKEETKTLLSVEREKLNFEIQKLVSDRLQISIENIFILNQTHGDRFYNSDNLDSRVPLDGDALFSTKTESVLIVKTADCMPIFFWSNKVPLVGIIHSGWKGTELGISEKLFLHLSKLGLDLTDVDAYLGPCARKKNYEVDEDLFFKFKNYFPDAIEKNGNHKYNLGIDLVLKERLVENSIPINLIDSEICTIEDDLYYSHRRKDLGRNINLIFLKKF